MLEVAVKFAYDMRKVILGFLQRFVPASIAPASAVCERRLGIARKLRLRVPERYVW